MRFLRVLWTLAPTVPTALAASPAQVTVAAADVVSTSVFERLEDRATGFPRDQAPWFRRAFDVVSSDMDLDGDPDVLINWHHHEALELLENRDGRFVHANPEAADLSGLDDNPGISGLFVKAAEMQRRIEAAGSAGLHVWHDRNRAQSWRFWWRNDRAAPVALVFEVTTSLPIVEVSGLEDDEYERLDGRRLRVSLAAATTSRRFGIRVHRVATQLILDIATTPLPPIFVGRDRTLHDDPRLVLWKPDPHGIAWLNSEGTGHPELFITRGGLGGELAPPAAPKRDRYYLAAAAGEALRYRNVSNEILPTDYGRGRRPEWVDVDGDGRLELSIANEHGPNSLLMRNSDAGEMLDRAAAWGLALDGAAVQTWGDYDRDGRPDLFYIDGRRVVVLRNTGAGFEVVPAAKLGLSLPESEAHVGVIDPAALRLADFDADGDLDLWVLALGRERLNRLFRRDQSGYVDVTTELGLADTAGPGVVIPLDVDNDGFEDLVKLGEPAAVWSNESGRGFAHRPLPPEIEAAGAASVLDFDVDGALDVVAAGRSRQLLRNLGNPANGFLRVAFEKDRVAPIGALVSAHYADGRVRTQRYGSADNSAFSQALQPLHFGIPAGTTITAIEVQWPGSSERVRKPIRDPGTQLVLER